MRRGAFFHHPIRTRHLAPQPIDGWHDEQIQLARARPVLRLPRAPKPVGARGLRHARDRSHTTCAAAGIDLDASFQAPLFRRDRAAWFSHYRASAWLLHTTPCRNASLFPQRGGIWPLVLQDARSDPRGHQARRTLHIVHAGSGLPHSHSAQHAHPPPRPPRVACHPCSARFYRHGHRLHALNHATNNHQAELGQSPQHSHHRLRFVARRPPRLRRIPPAAQRRTSRGRSLPHHRQAGRSIDPFRKLLHGHRLDHRVRHSVDDLTVSAQPWHPPNVPGSRNGRDHQAHHHADRKLTARKRL